MCARLLGAPKVQGTGVGPVGDAAINDGSGIVAPDIGLGEPFEIEVDLGLPRAGGKPLGGIDGESDGSDETMSTCSCESIFDSTCLVLLHQMRIHSQPMTI